MSSARLLEVATLGRPAGRQARYPVFALFFEPLGNIHKLCQRSPERNSVGRRSLQQCRRLVYKLRPLQVHGPTITGLHLLLLLTMMLHLLTQWGLCLPEIIVNRDRAGLCNFHALTGVVACQPTLRRALPAPWPLKLLCSPTTTTLAQ